MKIGDYSSKVVVSIYGRAGIGQAARLMRDQHVLLQAMRLSGIRRAPVVDARGALVGIIAIDDVIAGIAGLMCDMAGSINSEHRREWRTRVA